jgi:uncharacterized protein Yka (UPF0111/DUF47 family)
MFSLQKMLSKDDDFFELLEKSADEARRGVATLNRILATPDTPPSLAEFHQSKEANKKITKEINEALVNKFIVEIDREDVEMLSSALYKISKTVEKFAERFIISSRVVRGTDFSRHIKLLEAATTEVVGMVQQLRKKVPLARVKAMNVVLQQVEGDADNLILNILEDLYSGRHEPTKVTAMKDLYELLEKVIDRCRDAGNVVTQIAIKTA